MMLLSGRLFTLSQTPAKLQRTMMPPSLPSRVFSSRPGWDSNVHSQTSISQWSAACRELAGYLSELTWVSSLVKKLAAEGMLLGVDFRCQGKGKSPN